MHTALLAATVTDSSGSLVGTILQYGLLGLLLLDVGLTHRIFVPAWVLAKEQAERDRERTTMQTTIDRQAAIITQLTDNFMKEVVPALTRSTDVAKEYVDQLQERQRRDHP